MNTELPYWESLVDELYLYTVTTISTFAVNHSEELCSCVAFVVPLSSPYLGIFTVNFDTADNFSQSAQKIQDKILADRNEMLINSKTGKWRWDIASDYTDRMSIFPYNSDVSSFKYHTYGQLQISELQTLEEKTLPKDENAIDDYISGNIRIMLWHVSNRIIENNNLQVLNLTSPFYLGYQLVDDDNEQHQMVMLRILNWPYSIEVSS